MTIEPVRTRLSAAITYGRTSATSSPMSGFRWVAAPATARPRKRVDTPTDSWEAEGDAGGQKGVNARRCLPLEEYRALVRVKARRILLSTLFSSYR